MTTKTDNINLPSADEAAAYMYPSQLEIFESGEHIGEAYSIAVGSPDTGEHTMPLFTLEQIRTAVQADRQRGGEPVGYVAQNSIEWITDSERSAMANTYVALYKSPQPAACVAIYTSSQPAEPGKVPSDEEIDDLIGNCRPYSAHESERQYFHRLIRNALQRFGHGQPVASAEPVAEITHCKPDNYNANHRIRWLTQQAFPAGTKLFAAHVVQKPVGYLSCDPETGKPVWSEACVCEDNVYSVAETGTIGRPIVFADAARAQQESQP